MKLSDDNFGNTVLVRAYAPGEVRVGETLLRRSCVLMADRIIDWRPDSFSQLSLDDMTGLIELQPELVVLGTGTRQRFPDRALMSAVLSRGIGLEVMDCGAACRTYNVLVSEDRRVAAALLLRDD